MIQGYMAVANKCAVDIEELRLPISRDQALKLLWTKGFRVVDVNVSELAKSRVGKAIYKRGAPFYQAPFTVDCSTLTKWVYSKAGVWLPRHSIDQRDMGLHVEIGKAGDLVFMKGSQPYWKECDTDGVGHV